MATAAHASNLGGVTFRIASIGDSFTEGVGDELPDGTAIGWADRLAAALATALAPEDVFYANFAIRGRLLEPIATEQLDAALALDPTPDLITMAGGGNDMMRPGWDVDRAIELMGEAVRRTRSAGVRLLILSGGDPSAQLPRGGLVMERANELMEAIAEMAADEDHVVFLNNLEVPELRTPRVWSEDRLHLNPLGHRVVAARVLAALGHAAEVPEVDLSEVPRGGFAAQARYAVRYVLPWIGRRLTGRSSGDGRVPKFADWTPVEASVTH